MGQEFVIKSTALEDKINQLLPSQGGAAAGVDLSASSMIVPIIDLTESAEGSSLRQDLQTSFSHTTTNSFAVSNTTTTIITTTGYYRLLGSICWQTAGSLQTNEIIISDGTTDKVVYGAETLAFGTGDPFCFLNFDFLILLQAGDSCKIKASSRSSIKGSFRQVAALDGTLTNP